MRSLMVVIPDECLDGAAAGGKRAERPLRPQDQVTNAQPGADILEPHQPVRIARVAHREGERVIGEDGFDGIRERSRDLLEERGRRRTGLLGPNRDHGLAAEVVDGGEHEVMPRIAQRRQLLQVEMEQLAGPMLFVAPRRGPRRSRQLIDAASRLDALHRAPAEAHGVRDAGRTQPLGRQPQ